MLTHEKLLSYGKEDLHGASKALDGDDLKLLIGWLSEKDDTLRYHSFLLLQYRSEDHADVYPYWDVFCEKLSSTNSYQRSIGLMLIAANVKWDEDNRINNVIDDYLLILKDEKPITVRQCIQSLGRIVEHKSHLNKLVADRLIALDLGSIKETMRKLVLLDILSVLAVIRKQEAIAEADNYIFNALSGGMLDKKSIRQIEAMLGME